MRISNFHVFVAALMLVANVANADTIEIVKVEETWALSVGEPNTVRNAPQVSMVMAPFSNVESDYFILLLNHRTEPSYAAGGMQLQQWNGEQLVEHRNGPNGTELNSTGETISWTQTLSVSGGVVTFELEGGTSQSWGNFGGQGYLTKTIATGQANLNAYDPLVSIGESGIGFAGNRVASLTLMRIRWTLSDGRQFDVVAPINIDTDLDPWEE
jgi:hypothetical protein